MLLKCILSEKEVSREAFERWVESVVFDDLDFEAFKLLPALYLKCHQHQWESPLFLRMKGAYRRTWAENQLLITHLHELLSELETLKVEFLVADETIRLVRIYDDLGIYSLQNFSLAAPFGVKRSFEQSLLKCGWETIAQSFELSVCQKEKVSNLRIYWIDDTEFGAQARHAGNVLIKDVSLPVLSIEEQVIGLCEKEFVGYREELSRWQFVAAEIVNREILNYSKLISTARERDVARHVAAMFRSLKDDFDVNIEEQVIDELIRNSLSKLSSLKRKAQNIWQSYQVLKKYGGSEISVREFLAQRWKADSNTILIKRAAEAGVRSLQSK